MPMINDEDSHRIGLCTSKYDDTQPIYRCRFVNKSEKSVDVKENGKVLIRDLEPGMTLDVEMNSPDVTYAPFERITFRDDRVDIDRNDKWVNAVPEGAYPIEIINTGGASMEVLYLHGQKVECYQNIPRYSYVNLDDAYVYYQKIEIVKVDRRIKVGNYFDIETKIEKIRTLRPKKVLREITERMEREALAGIKLPEVPADVKEDLK